MKLTAQQLDLLTEVTEDYGGTVRTDYSGRAMFGARCVGIDVPTVRDAVKVLVALAETDPGLARSLAADFTWDNMGLGFIVYFPSAQAPGGGEGR